MDMDFMNHACATEDDFFLSDGNFLSSSKNKSKQKSQSKASHQTTNSSSKEDPETISSLQKELRDSHSREKALVKEFTNKFRQLHLAAPTSFHHVNVADVSSPAMSSDEEMPMDEMAATAKMERAVRTMESLEQKRAMDDFKRRKDQEISRLRKKNDAKVNKIAQQLKEKVININSLTERFEIVETERDRYKKENTELASNAVSARSAMSLSPANNDGSPMNTPMGNTLEKQRSSLTPLQRLRFEQMKQTPPTHTMDSAENSPSLAPGIFDPNNIMNTENSTTPKSRLGALFESVVDPSLNSLHHLLQVVEDSIFTGEDEASAHDEINEAYIKLSDGEKEFVDRVKAAFETSHREHFTMIENLKDELEETNQDLQQGELEMVAILEEKQSNLQELQNELLIAKESVKNKCALEGMLKMVADDQKSSLVEYTDLKRKLKETEQARCSLLSEKKDILLENDNAISALRRVMVDLTSEKEAAVSDFAARLDSMGAENVLLKQKLDPSYDALSHNIVTIDGNELSVLHEKAARYLDAERKLKDREPTDHARNVEKLEQELDIANETIQDLEQQLSKDVQSPDEMVLLQLQDLQKEKEELEENAVTAKKEFEVKYHEMQEQISELRNIVQKSQEEKDALLPEIIQTENTITVLLNEKELLENKCSVMESEIEIFKSQAKATAEVLKTAKKVHAREHILEKELCGVQVLLDESMKDNKHQSNEMAQQFSQLEAKLHLLQIEVIEMKEEKLALKTKVRETEIALERSNRIMSLMQETSDTEGTASLAILDLKEQLRDELDLLSKLRHCCDQDGSFMIVAIEGKVNMILCLLETNVLGINGSTSIAPFDFSVGASPKEQLLERSLSRQRAENDRICKNIDELRTEKDQETAVLGIELASLQGKYTLKRKLLQEREEELKVLHSTLNETSISYISEDESDLEDDDTSVHMAIPIQEPHDDTKVNEMCASLRDGKEAAEEEAKKNSENLAEAKMIISSLEQSNKATTENLRSRLHDSNAAILSLLDDSKKHESTNADLKKKLNQIIREKQELESKLLTETRNSSEQDELISAPTVEELLAE